MRRLPRANLLVKKLEDRYLLEGTEAITCEDVVKAVGDKLFQGDMERAGARILKDFRDGYLGIFALELPVGAAYAI